MTISFDEARKIAQDYLEKITRRHALVLLDRLTREEDFGWVFFYNSKLFVETRDINHALGGNAPIIVNRVDGSLYETGTAHSIDYYILEYRRGRRRD